MFHSRRKKMLLLKYKNFSRYWELLTELQNFLKLKKKALKICNTSALLSSLHGSETWARKEQDKSRMSEEMIFMGRMAI
jgi:hypothetical protein